MVDLYTEDALASPSQAHFGTIRVQNASSSVSESYEEATSERAAT